MGTAANATRENKNRQYMTHLLSLQAQTTPLLEQSDPQLITRRWHSEFYITGLQNLETRKQKFFLLIRFGHINRFVQMEIGKYAV